MKTIVPKMRESRLLLPMLWFTVIFFVAVLCSCTGSDKDNATNQTKIYAPAKSQTTTADAATADKSNTTDFAYSYTQDEAQTAPETVESSTKVGKSSYALLPVKAENAFETVTADIFGVDKTVAQTFTINNSKDVEVTGVKGIKVLFPAGCLDVRDAAGPVKIELKEYLTYEDMLFAGLSTESDGRMIESGGTVDIRAYIDGKEINLKDGGKIQITFPTGRSLPDMQTFYGQKRDNGDVNWNASNIPVTIDRRKVKTFFDDKSIKRVPDTLIGENFKLFGVYDNEPDKLNEFNYKFLEAFNRDLFFSDSLIDLTYSYRFNPSFWLNKDNTIRDFKIKYQLLRQTDTLTKQQFKTVRNERRKIKRSLKRSIYSVIKHLAPKDTALYNENMISFNLDLHKTGFTSAQRGIYQGKIAYFRGGKKVSMKEYYMPADKFYTEKIKNDAESYLLYSERLGYINCDRFNSGPKTSLVVTTLKPKNELSVKIIFPKLNAIMNMYGSLNEHYRVQGVPINEDVKILVIEMRDGVQYYALKNANTSHWVKDDFEFKPYTVAALRKDLASL